MNSSIKAIIGIWVIVIGVCMFFGVSPFSGNHLKDSDSIGLNGIDKIVVNGSSEKIRIMTSSDDNIRAELNGKTSGFSFKKQLRHRKVRQYPYSKSKKIVIPYIYIFTPTIRYIHE